MHKKLFYLLLAAILFTTVIGCGGGGGGKASFSSGTNYSLLAANGIPKAPQGLTGESIDPVWGDFNVIPQITNKYNDFIENMIPIQDLKKLTGNGKYSLPGISDELDYTVSSNYHELKILFTDSDGIRAIFHISENNKKLNYIIILDNAGDGSEVRQLIYDATGPVYKTAMLSYGKASKKGNDLLQIWYSSDKEEISCIRVDGFDQAEQTIHAFASITNLRTADHKTTGRIAEYQGDLEGFKLEDLKECSSSPAIFNDATVGPYMKNISDVELKLIINIGYPDPGGITAVRDGAISPEKVADVEVNLETLTTGLDSLL